MEILTFIFLILNFLVMLFVSFMLYRINYYSLENRHIAKNLIYSDFWNQDEVKDYDLYS